MSLKKKLLNAAKSQGHARDVAPGGLRGLQPSQICKPNYIFKRSIINTFSSVDFFYCELSFNTSEIVKLLISPCGVLHLVKVS